MTIWLYQMRAEKWTPEQYREVVWEGEVSEWTTGKIISNNKKQPKEGDTIIFYFTKTGNKEPGLYGWGVILKYYENWDSIRFRTVRPSDYLKMSPLWDEEVEKIVNEIRNKQPQATMWEIVDNEAKNLRKKVHEWT